MLKHVGQHNNRKVVVLYREVPEEPHMALIVYSDVLPRIIHDTVMSVLESAPGQQAASLADVLFRNIMADGRNSLEVLHREGFIKKVQTSQIIITPTTNSQIRLDELNTMLAEMEKGEEAVKRMRELDEQRGMTSKKNTPKNEAAPQQVAEPAIQAPADGVLSDSDIANQQLVQATRMRNEAKSLLAEADRLEKEAAALIPTVKVKAPTKAKATVNDNSTATTTKKAKASKVKEG